jgi:hypothetical protein
MAGMDAHRPRNNLGMAGYIYKWSSNMMTAVILLAQSSTLFMAGELNELIQLLGKSTAYIERDNLTSRIFNARQNRKTLAFSKKLENHRASAVWEDGYYNLVKYHKSLRLPVEDIPDRKWQQRTPMMAAGLTKRPWTVKELLTTIPIKL